MKKEHWDKIIEGKISDANKRGTRKRGWIKLDKAWLTSSINYRMELSEIAVFSKLIVMADEFGPVPGLISDNDFRPMPHDYLAHQACCPLDVFEKTLEKGIADDSIYENSRGIFLTHFDDYQFTEYDRQKQYRQKPDDSSKPYGKFENVFLSNTEYQKLIDTLGDTRAKELIEDLSFGIGRKGYKYKSHYITILSWDRRDKKEGGQGGTHRGSARSLTERHSYTKPEDYGKH